MSWETISPHSNPTEHLWGVLKRKMEQNNHSRKKQLKLFVSEEQIFFFPEILCKELWKAIILKSWTFCFIKKEEQPYCKAFTAKWIGWYFSNTAQACTHFCYVDRIAASNLELPDQRVVLLCTAILCIYHHWMPQNNHIYLYSQQTM